METKTSVSDHPVEVIGDNQGNNHMVIPPQPAINNTKDPLQVSKVSIQFTAPVLNLLWFTD